MKKLLIILLLSSILFSQEIIIGVVPQQSPLELSKIWLRVVEYLNNKTGLQIIFKTEQSIPLFEEKLYRGEYDISYMNPYHFTVAAEKQKYSAFLRSKENIVGIVLARKDDVFDVNNLKNKTFLFPTPNAFAATIVIKYELKQLYNFDVEKDANVLYVNTHDSVYKGIAREIGDFGGGIIRTFDNFKEDEDKDKICIVYQTKDYPSHPFAAHPRVDKKTVELLEKAFIEMPEELKKSLSIKEFIHTTSQEYDVIKNLNIK
jgi:phosphonate transport system substrate-binding protein